MSFLTQSSRQKLYDLGPVEFRIVLLQKYAQLSAFTLLKNIDFWGCYIKKTIRSSPYPTPPNYLITVAHRKLKKFF